MWIKIYQHPPLLTFMIWILRKYMETNYVQKRVDVDVWMGLREYRGGLQTKKNQKSRNPAEWPGTMNRAEGFRIAKVQKSR